MSFWSNEWRPPHQALDRASAMRDLEVGMVIGLDYRAWEVMHIRECEPTDDNPRDRLATFRRLHGPRHERENSVGDVPFRYSSRGYGMQVYRDGIVWLCSCCGHPAPCRMQVAVEISQREAKSMDERIKRMGVGICYGCGEVITQRQERITMPGEHADFPGRSGPTFHTRQKCADERWAYAKRAGINPDGTAVAELTTEESE